MSINATEAIASELVTVIARTNEIDIVDGESFTAVHGKISQMKALEREIKEHFAPMKEAAHKAHKAVTTAENAQLKPLTDAIAAGQKRLAAYQAKMRQYETEARLLAEEDARNDRKADILEMAEQVEQVEGTAAAEAYIVAAQAMPVAPVPEVKLQADAKGGSMRNNWMFEVTDKLAVPIAYMTPDLTYIGAVVRAKKGNIIIPGVRIWNDPKFIVK